MAWSLCVYCGSRNGDVPAFSAAARRVGEALVEAGGRLVYGGGKAGLMGVVADAVMGAGGEVVGVIPQALMDREVGHRGITELHVVQTMHQRKTMMAERADAFLALPGGIGTLEELFEVWSWHQLGYHDKPVGLLDVDGYYTELVSFLHGAHRRGFVSEAQLGALHIDTEIDRLLRRLREAAAGALAPDDYRGI